MPDPIPDRYEPKSVVGLGGQGHVLHAIDRRHDRPVAIKVRRASTEAERESLLPEARVLLTVEPHPNLPLAREDFFVDDRYCIVMDWIEGRSLGQLLSVEDGDGLPVEFVLDALEQVASALDHLHAHSPPVLHLDVKPSNVIRRQDGRFVLVDFGLSGRRAKPYTGGTPVYLAPELASGVDALPSADVFSLAVTAFELITGRLPVPGRPPTWPPLPSDVLDRIRSGLQRGLATDPARRPRTASDLVSLLRPARVEHNLPAALSTFVGREREIAEAASLLGGCRCLTLVGSGGVGKTRLALEVARSSMPAFSGGVRLVELAALRDAGGLVAHVARAVGLREETGRGAFDALVDRLGRGNQLLVLDNCEHLVEACAHLAEDLLRACGHLRILATSREAVRIPGEVVWRVPPMTVPDDDAPVGRTEAVRLFNERAVSADPRFEPDEATRRTIGQICRTLEGIPLAIELAAALAGDRSIDDVASGLDRMLSTLVRGPRTEPRQETVRATLDWSYGLLSDAERVLLSRLSVFAGSFTADAAHEICGGAEALDRLVARSLCEIRDDGRGIVNRLLEPVRQFAAERLASSGDEAQVRDRHLSWHLDLALRAAARLRRADQTEWSAVLDAVSNDLSAATAWSASTQRFEDARRIAASLGPFWERRGRWSEGRSALERSLSDGGTTPFAARALIELASIARLQGDLGDAESACAQAVELATRSGEPSIEARARAGLGRLRSDRGDHAEAARILGDALEMARRLHDDDLVCDVLADLGRAEHFLGDISAAGRAYDEAHDIAQRLGDHCTVARTEANKGTVAFARGDVKTARASFERARTMAADLHDDDLLATATSWVATCLTNEGDHQGARNVFEESLELFHKLGHKQRVAQTLCELAIPVVQQREFAAGRELLEESLALSTELGLHLTVGECLHKLSLVAHAEGDDEAAISYLAEAVDICAEHGDLLRLAMLIEHGAVVAAAAQRARDAITLSAAANAHRRRIGFPRGGQMRVLDEAIGAAEDALGEAQTADARQRGESMDLDQAVASVRLWCAEVSAQAN